MYLDDASKAYRKSLQESKGMPLPSKNLVDNFGNSLLAEEMSYDVVKLC